MELVPQTSVLFNLLFDGSFGGFHGFNYLIQAVVVVVAVAIIIIIDEVGGGDGQAGEFIGQFNVVVAILHVRLSNQTRRDVDVGRSRSRSRSRSRARARARVPKRFA